jgi:hypothetical protein
MNSGMKMRGGIVGSTLLEMGPSYANASGPSIDPPRRQQFPVKSIRFDKMGAQRVQAMVRFTVGNIFLVPLGCSGGKAAWTV